MIRQEPASTELHCTTGSFVMDGMFLLAPDIVEAIVNGAEPDGLSIAQIMKRGNFKSPAKFD